MRGRLALIKGGSGTIIGTCVLSDVVGPLTKRQLHANADKLNVPASELGEPYYGARTYAWVLTQASRLDVPVPYEHPQGAVIWVTLADNVLRKLPR